jgi:hypothetical protein
MIDDPNTATARPSRIRIVRDVALFQGKLLLDGLRDLILVPISLIAALIDLFDDSVEPGHHFYRVVRFGRRTEKWIDLFGAGPADSSDDPKFGLADRGLDDLVERIEGTIKRQYKDAEDRTGARRQLEDLLERIRRDGDESGGSSRQD